MTGDLRAKGWVAENLMAEGLVAEQSTAEEQPGERPVEEQLAKRLMEEPPGQAAAQG